MDNLFEKAKHVALSRALEWLPPGSMRGSEYVCKNPTRADNSIGSFSINLTTGKWGDFADDAGGNDLVSCYAYIHRSAMEQRSRDKQYKNIDSGVQTEAATALLEKFDPFALAAQDSKPKQKGAFWDGFRQITTGLKEPLDPKSTFQFYSKMWGDFSKHWEFTDKKGRVMFLIARFYGEDGKKADRPFSPWTNGTETRWRPKNLEGVKLPLYNLVGLEAESNLPILMTEGQKNAEQGRELLSGAFVTSAYYRGVDKTDLEPLRGRTVYYWFDPDGAGRKKLKSVEEALSTYQVIFHAVHSPTGKPKGWDLSDAIEEGWGKQKIIDHVLNIEPPKQEVETGFLDDCDFPYRIIGQTANDIYFFAGENCMVMKFRRSNLGKANLMNLMARDLWGSYYAKPDGGIAWDAAADFIIRAAAKTPVFTPTLIRGAGAWVEQGKTVINTGSSLIVDGIEGPLFQKETRFIYEKRKSLPYSIKNPGCTDVLKRVMSAVDFSSEDHARFLSGWLLLAPFGGALPWRPHVWLSGEQGAGKSFILDQIAAPMISDFAVMGNGSSTVAGIRQSLGGCTQPMLLDEAEGDTVKKREIIEEALTLARIASSGGENPMGMLHGNQDGTGTTWLVGSMFLFASIGATIIHSADKNRITLLKLNSPSVGRQKERAEKFKILKSEIGKLTPEFARGFHARTISIWPEVLKSVETFTEMVTGTLGTRREGDQVGTLIAGSWIMDHDIAPTAEQAMEYISEFKTLSGERIVGKQDGELCLDEILAHTLEIDHKKMSVGSWLAFWFSIKGAKWVDRSEFNDMPDSGAIGMIKRSLSEIGVKPVITCGNFGIQVAINHPKIKMILKNTAWPETYPEIMERSKSCIKKNRGPSNFGFTQKRFNEFDAESVLAEEIPF